MNAIDIPIKIWNQYIDLKNGDDLPLKIKIELFEKDFQSGKGLLEQQNLIQ